MAAATECGLLIAQPVLVKKKKFLFKYNLQKWEKDLYLLKKYGLRELQRMSFEVYFSSYTFKILCSYFPC